MAKLSDKKDGVSTGRMLLLIGNESYTSSVEQSLKRVDHAGSVELEVMRVKNADSIAARIARGVYTRVLISAFNKHRLLLPVENAAKKAQVELRFCSRCGTRELAQALAA